MTLLVTIVLLGLVILLNYVQLLGLVILLRDHGQHW
jgi:hypothetical protein